MIHQYDLISIEGRQHFPYVTVYDQVIPPQFCQKLIDKFNRNDHDEQRETVLKGVRHFMEVNISQFWHDEHETFVAIVQEAWKVYQSINNITFDVQWPRQFGYEQFRMKRYLPNGLDEFALHTDVGSYGSARRFVSFLWYLNTVQEGGSTQFGFAQDKPEATIPAVQGRLLMFPPLWTHPHWGCKPISGPKYIVSGYLHYI